jgi:imidazoleglycerol-phosphate dehydratase
MKGNIGVTTENIFPVIKKFLYSDHDIFIREIVSNAVDATQKLRTIAQKGELKGDLEVDQHHLIEDTGISLGMCFAKALGDCAGIRRAGCFIYPMDESLLRAAVDFGGRPFLVCNADLSGIPLVSVQDGKSGTFQTDCFDDFWNGFVQGARCNLHLDTLRGRSDHHKMEGLFKAAARAMRSAVEIDERRRGSIPSTKGVIV